MNHSTQEFVNKINKVSSCISANYKRVIISDFSAVIQSGDKGYVHLWLNDAPIFSLYLNFETSVFTSNDRVSIEVFNNFVKGLDSKAIKHAVWPVVSV